MLADTSQRFIFDETDIRGDLVQLEQSYQKILAPHQYSTVIQQLLGEFLVAASLLSRTIKFDGRLILQAKTEGPIGTIMAEANSSGKIRGIARPNGEVADQAFADLFRAGTLVVTIEPAKGEPYHSMVPLEGETLAECLEHYFRQSEQLNTSLSIAADSKVAAGLLLQQLPKQLVTSEEARAEQWQHVRLLAKTLSAEELRSLTATGLLDRLYAQQPIRLLDVESVSFFCSCSEARMAKALLAIAPSELASLFEEESEIALNCEFCQSAYQFTQQSLANFSRGDETIQ